LVDILPPWKMYFDRAARNDDVSAGVVFVFPKKHVLTYLFILTQLCFKHQTLILGLQMAVKIGIKDHGIYDGSLLVIKQLPKLYDRSRKG